MASEALKHALLKNKILLVKHILRLNGQRIDAAAYREITESDALEEIEAKLKAPDSKTPIEKERWLQRWLKN